MPHIPEEELHAYLDQALARLRCVEIESHLAECTRCRLVRDDIVALRDHTTAILAKLAPRRTAGPPFAEIRRRAADHVAARQRTLHRGAWAASILVALGVGWTASFLVHPRAERLAARTQAATRSVSAPIGGDSVSAPVLQLETPAPSATPALASRNSSGRHPDAVVKDRSAAQRPGAGLATVGRIPKDAHLELGGVWRTLSWDGAKEEAGDSPARIDGLPVVEVQVQRGDGGKKPLMVVAQQLASGEVVRTIDGPVTDVSALLGTRPTMINTESTAAGPVAPGAGRAALGSALALRHGDRMVAVAGSVPSDSLRAMMRRLNLMTRVR
jgi:anti-sigma factor RsiW